MQIQSDGKFFTQNVKARLLRASLSQCMQQFMMAVDHAKRCKCLKVVVRFALKKTICISLIQGYIFLSQFLSLRFAGKFERQISQVLGCD